MKPAALQGELTLDKRWRVQGSGFRVQAGFRVQVSGFRVQGAGYREHDEGGEEGEAAGRHIERVFSLPKPRRAAHPPLDPLSHHEEPPATFQGGG